MERLARPGHATTGQCLRAIIVEDPFRPAASRRVREIPFDPDRSLLYYQRLLVPADPADVVASVNGRVIPMERVGDTYIRPGDEVLLVPSLRGGGGDGKSVLRAVALLAVAVGAWYAAPFIAGGTLGVWTGAGLGTVAIAGAISVVGGLVVNALLPPVATEPPSMRASGSDATSVYSWSGPLNTQQQGLPIPWIYGTVRYGGNIINSSLEDRGDDQQYLNVLVCLGEGPYDSISDIEINGQPHASYRGVTSAVRLGDLDQTMIPWFDDTVTEYAQSLLVSSASPVTHRTPGGLFDALEVELTWNGLVSINQESGAFVPTTVAYRVEFQKVGTATWHLATLGVASVTETTGRWSAGYMLDGTLDFWREAAAGSANPADHYEGQYYGWWSDPVYGGYWPCSWHWLVFGRVVDVTLDYVTVTAATSKALRRTVRFNVPETGRYDVRITRLTPDNDGAYLRSSFSFTALREIYRDDFTHPTLALLGTHALATDNLSGSFSLTALVRGKLVRVLDGVVWTVRYSANPAWVVYHALTQPRYDNSFNVLYYRGCDPSQIDLAAVADFADWCDELVDDGEGGTRPRFEFNGVIDVGGNLWEQCLAICQEAQASMFYDGMIISFVIDRPTSPSRLYTVGSISKSSFRGEFLSIDDRAGQIECRFRNAAKNYDMDQVLIIDPALDLQRENKISLTLKGCTSEAQAWAYGMHRLRSNNYLVRSGSFDVDVEALSSTVGDVIYVQHDIPEWGAGGRIVSATATTATLDRQVTMLAGVSYALLVQSADGTLLERSIVTQPGTTATVAVAAAFDPVPELYDPYTFGPVGAPAKPFRVAGIRPLGDFKRTLEIVEYIDAIYDQEAPVITTAYSALEPGVSPVRSLSAEEHMVRKGGTIEVLIEVTFVRPRGLSFARAEIWYRSDASPQWRHDGDCTTGEYTLHSVADGMTYEVRAVSVDLWGNKQDFDHAEAVTIWVFGKTAPPSDVAAFWGTPSIGGLRLDWTAVPDVDIDHYRLRFTPALTWVWENALDVASVYATTITLPAARSGTYLIKAVDVLGNESATALALTTDIPAIIGWNVKETLTEDPTFTGTKTRMSVADDMLRLDAEGDVDDQADFDDIEDLDNLGAVYSDGYYETDEIDLGSVQSARCSVDIDFIGVDLSTTWDAFASFDLVPSVDGDVSGVSLTTQIALSQNGSTWGDWQNFVTGDFTAQAFKFRVKAESTVSTQYPAILALAFTVDMPDRTETGRDVAIDAPGTAIVFTKAFMMRPVVRISIQSATSGDTAVLTSMDETGFTVQVQNGGSGAARTIDWEAAGY